MILTFKCEGSLHDRCKGERFTFTLGVVPCECHCHKAGAA